MKVNKHLTETYEIYGLKKLDPITVYVRNYGKNKTNDSCSGKITIEIYGDSWSYLWGGMGKKTAQEFFVSCDNGYLIGKLIGSRSTYEIDYNKISYDLQNAGDDLAVESLHDCWQISCNMEKLYGEDWVLCLPETSTTEAVYLDRIITAIKEAFNEEIAQKLSS